MKKRKTEIKLVFSGGVMRAVYKDELIPIFKHGTPTIRRASHVEPSPDGKTWQADMSPVGGGILTGFRLHRQAITAETKYINERVL